MERARSGDLERRGYLALRRLRDAALAPAARVLARAGVPAWAVSLAGVAAAATTFALLPAHPRLALAALAGALLADLFDGAVARAAGRAGGRGKLLDHACDAATFAALVLAAGARGLAPAGTALAAALTSAAAVGAALAASARRDRRAFREDPRAGFWAHLPKLPVFVAYPALLAGGPDLLAQALLATAWGSAAVAVAVLMTALRRARKPAPTWLLQKSATPGTARGTRGPRARGRPGDGGG